MWSKCLSQVLYESYTVKYNYASIEILGQSNDEECQLAAKTARDLVQPEQSPINTRKMCARFDVCVNNSIRVNRFLIHIICSDLSAEHEELKNSEIFCSSKLN